MIATLVRYAEIVKILLSEGANPNATDIVGDTALDLANEGWSKAKTQEEAKEFKRIVEILKAAGAK